MKDLEFSFDMAPWEEALEAIADNGSIGVVQLLTLLEGESEAGVEEALLQLELRHISLDISGLPRPQATGEAALRLRREIQWVENNEPVEALEETDPLRLYLEEVASLPAAGDIQLMAERFAGGYDPVLPGLTNLMLSTVIAMAKEMTGWGVLLMDLIQEASLGLWQGILSFRSGEFEPHAQWWIRQYLHRAVLLQARETGLGQRMKQAMEDYRMVDERLLSDLGRNPTVEEIAEAMHMRPAEVEAVAGMVENARFLSRAKQETAPVEEDPEEEQHVEDTALFQSRQRIEEMLCDLTQEERKLISLRFGLEGGLPLSAEDTGAKLGLTASEVVAMETAALAKMRNA
jgi:RNA polymerase primary sigma factor